MDATAQVTKIVRNMDGAIADLPLGFQPTFCDVPQKWSLVGNWSAKQCILKNFESMAQMPVSSLYPWSGEASPNSALASK
eukprot:9767982-Lingulodinium_polyedra.AAC.1